MLLAEHFAAHWQCVCRKQYFAIEKVCPSLYYTDAESAYRSATEATRYCVQLVQSKLTQPCAYRHSMMVWTNKSVLQNGKSMVVLLVRVYAPPIEANQTIASIRAPRHCKAKRKLSITARIPPP